jgi:hypothetical protein
MAALDQDPAALVVTRNLAYRAVNAVPRSIHRGDSLAFGH